MNDFLQSLRGNPQKEKRTPKTRRGYDSGNHYNAPSGFQGHGSFQSGRSGNVKRPATRATAAAPSHLPGGDHQTPYLSMDPMEIMMELMDIYTKNQELLINIAERRVLVEERKAGALEEIAASLRESVSPGAVKALMADRASQASGVTDAPHGATDAKLEETPMAGHGARGEASSGNEDNAAVSERVPDQDVGDDRAADMAAQSDHVEAMADEVRGAAAHSVKRPQVEESRPFSTHTAQSKSRETGVEDDDLFSSTRTREPQTRKPKFIPETIKRKPSVTAKAATEEKSAVLRKRARTSEEPAPEKRKVGRPRTKDAATETVKVIKRKRAEESMEKPASKAPAATSQSSGTTVKSDGLLSRNEVMEIIESMRAKGATFDQVAKHLVDLGQPTFSGRGEWHAQTIHRLCNRKSKKK